MFTKSKLLVSQNDLQIQNFEILSQIFDFVRQIYEMFFAC